MKQRASFLYVSYAIIKAIVILSLISGSMGAETAPAPPTSPVTWNFLVYIAANNNLFRYGQHNIKEMQQIGSNKNINLFVQIDNFGKREVTRYKIEKGKSTAISTQKTIPTSLSGTTENLFDFVKEITTKYPADKHAIILWNHGSGAKDPHLWRQQLPYIRENCFRFNPKTNLFEIDRTILNLRGIAFNDIGHTYLTNPDLKVVLEKISTEILGGKKIDLLGMDACHMAMVEIASQVKNAANILVGSEEVEPGPGWDYVRLLNPFRTKSLTPIEFAKQIVDAYGAKYNALFADLTQSAIDLQHHEALEKNIDAVATLLISLIDDQKNSFLPTVKQIRQNPKHTISFLDSDYIDLPFFYKTLLATINKKVLSQTDPQRSTINQLKKILEDGIKLFSTQIIHNTTGRNVKAAGGLSIYFPTRTLHTSYLKNAIAQTTNWGNFLYTYLKNNSKNNPKTPKLQVY